MQHRFITLFAILLAGLLGFALCGCPADDDDDDSAAGDDDDDTGVDPAAPVLSDFKLQYGGGATNCKVYTKFHAEDDEGDLAAQDDNGDPIYISIITDYSGYQVNWSYSTGAEATYVMDVSLDLGLEENEDGDPHLEPNTSYDVEVWLYDLANNESNHLFEEGFTTPSLDCT